MSDYIKELNIVDFLGVIVPGSVLVLLLAGDNASALLLWTSYFGAEATPIVRGIFLLIAGYLAGMVLHEIGDLAEKGVWCVTRLDPKAYAINAVGTENIGKATVTAKLKVDVSDNQRCVLSPRACGRWGRILALAILGSCLLGFPFAMQSSLKTVTVPQVAVDISENANMDPTDVTVAANIQTTAPTQQSSDDIPTNPTNPEKNVSVGTWSYIVAGSILLGLLIVLRILGCKICAKNKSENVEEKLVVAFWGNQNNSTQAEQSDNNNKKALPQKNQWELLERLCLLNPQIQTYVSQKGAPSKMSMFDSFRHVMRNLLIAVAIVNVFSCWHPIDLYRDVAAYFAKSGNMPLDFAMLTFWFCFVILFAFSRYSHFVYLRYKYSYEAFDSKVNEDSNPEISHHHLVIEHSPIPPNSP